MLRLEYDKQLLSITRSRKNKDVPRGEISIPLNRNNLIELKHFSVDETGVEDSPKEDGQQTTDLGYEPFSFVSMKIDPEATDLDQFTASYKPDGPDNKCKYVVLEFRADNEMFDMVNTIENSYDSEGIGGLESKLKPEKVMAYSESLVIDSKKERSSRLRTAHKKSQNSFLAGKKNDFILLVYPFAGDPKEIEAAAAGLNEARGNLSIDGQTNNDDPGATSSEQPNVKSVGSGDLLLEKPEATKVKSRQRAHYVTIRVEDYERLEPMEWLNDSLVDFWMQW